MVETAKIKNVKVLKITGDGNRIDDPDLIDVQKCLKARLWDEMKAQGDRLASRWTKVELQSELPMAVKIHGDHSPLFLTYC